MDKSYRTLNAIAWGVLFITLPITSMPMVSRFVGGTMVAPPAMIFLAVILLFWFLPSMLRGEKLTAQTIPLFFFFSLALISSLVSLFLETPSFKNQPNWKTTFEALITLALGMGYFVSIQTWMTKESRLRLVFQWVAISGVVLILWSLTQALYWHIDLHYPAWMRLIQESLSNGTMFARRATGFAFEPSWLAHQLNVFYFPIWMAAVFTRQSAFKWRVWKFQMEDALLLGGILVLVFTSSRIGFLGFIFLAAFLFFVLQNLLIQWIKKRIPNPKKWRWIRPLLISALIVLYLGLLFGAATVMQQRDPRMKEMFKLDTLRNGEFFTYAKKLTFASRVVYWQTGLQVFEEHPVLGVGLGNAGYYFKDAMPNDGWGLVEVRQLLIRDSSLPNIKNLWVRLLAETGLIGFFSFLAFWVTILWSGNYLHQQGSGLLKTIGFAAVLSCIAMIGEGFSLDTFALPYTWLIFGMCVAATRSDFLMVEA